ncbi:hypothetical protein E2542_SST31107 [Spatholobus suberectus]|nr:hypothetical protein E2542_SST31107 [Spatholobus suberectus]
MYVYMIYPLILLLLFTEKEKKMENIAKCLILSGKKKKNRGKQNRSRGSKQNLPLQPVHINILIQSPEPYSDPMTHQLKWVGRRSPTATGKSAGLCPEEQV